MEHEQMKTTPCKYKPAPYDPHIPMRVETGPGRAVLVKVPIDTPEDQIYAVAIELAKAMLKKFPSLASPPSGKEDRSDGN